MQSSQNLPEGGVQSDITNMMNYIGGRMKELKKINDSYSDGEIKTLAGLLVDLYATFSEYIEKSGKDEEELFKMRLILSILQIEIDAKERKIKYLINERRSRFESVDLKFDIQGISVRNRTAEAYAEVLALVDSMKKCIDSYFGHSNIKNSYKVKELVFEEKENFVEVPKNTKEFVMPDKYLAKLGMRYSAFELALALSPMKGIIYGMHLLDINNLFNDLKKNNLSSYVINSTSGSSNFLKELEMRFFSDSLDYNFFELVKEFHKIMNPAGELTQSKEALFSAEITEKIKQRIARIEAFCGYPPPFD